jgi:GT2 family glycosyltransferase
MGTSSSSYENGIAKLMTTGILIPTWNNNQFLIPCVRSILDTTDAHLYIVNNGEKEHMMGLANDRVTILQQERNLGWEGGLLAGLAASKEEFVVFMNDDTFIPPVSKGWLEELLSYFKDPKVAAVGPSSNVVMGGQSIFAPFPPDQAVLRSTFLIGFCVALRRSVLEEAGSVDDSLPGGDDLDLSLRLRQKGYELLIDRNAFVYHHGFKTGERINGGPNVAGGWNSVEMTEKTNFALIRKHGLKAWLALMSNQILGVYEFQPA